MALDCLISTLNKLKPQPMSAERLIFCDKVSNRKDSMQTSIRKNL